MSKFIEVKEITLESGDQHYRVNYPSNGIFLVNIKDDKAFFSVTDNEVLWIGSADSFTFVDAPDIVSPTNEVKEVQPSEGKVENTPETPSSGGIKVTMVEQGCKKCSEIYGLLNHGILKKCPSCGDNISYASVVYSNGDPEISFIEKEEKSGEEKEETILDKLYSYQMEKEKVVRAIENTISARDFINGGTPPNGYNPLKTTKGIIPSIIEAGLDEESET